MDSELLRDGLAEFDEGGWHGITKRRPIIEAARRVANPDKKAAVNAFWAHAADLLRPTVSSTGIDRAVEHAVDAALGVTEDE